MKNEYCLKLLPSLGMLQYVCPHQPDQGVRSRSSKWKLTTHSSLPNSLNAQARCQPPITNTLETFLHLQESNYFQIKIKLFSKDATVTMGGWCVGGRVRMMGGSNHVSDLVWKPGLHDIIKCGQRTGFGLQLLKRWKGGQPKESNTSPYQLTLRSSR